MKKSIFLMGGLLSVVSTNGSPKETNKSTANNDRPNFIIILADDMGYGDIGAFGNEQIKTPNIDRMAREGMLCKDFHSNGAVSTPTRCALLTGRYQQRAGLEGVILVTDQMDKIEAGLPRNEITFAQVLRDNGYKTALLGKWHLGYKEQYSPTNFGFDKYIGFKSGNVDYHSHRNRNGELDWWDGLELKDMPGYTTTLLTELSCDYIKENSNSPFCLYVAHAVPHTPLQGPNDAALRDGNNDGGDKPANKSAKSIYKEMIEELDNGVGKILNTLKECDIERNTLVVFFSDNGPVLKSGGSAGQYRGQKGNPYEGGHIVPGAIYMPGTVRAGNVCNQTLMSFDLFPTMIDMAQINYDDSAKPLDGTSLKPILDGGRIGERTLFWGLNKGVTAMRNGKWKAVRQGAKISLYDLESDPSESTDVAEKYPEIVSQFRTKLKEWQSSVYSEVPDQIRK